MRKVLVLTEATYLNTGYAADGREILAGLQKTGKYDIAEFSIYGTPDDPRRASIPWKNYANAPLDNDVDEIKNAYHSNPINQFGSWRFERVCLDFKPEYCIDIRDFWMCSFAKQSPYRELFNWIYKSTIDAVPQNSEWINTFASADKFLTISEWANDVIKEQSDQTNLLGTATICAPRSFKPVPKTPHRISMGLNPDWKIIGTVMRNQRRKLFPELFEAFGLYLKSSGDTQTYLYCHTSYPDNGWDIPQLLVKEEISSRVLFSYTCPCGHLTIAPFADSLQQCRNCKNFSAKPANVTAGASVDQLEKIYQCFDLYIQCANSEGLGIGVVEAAACGVPVMAVDYSAMSETSRKCGGFPIPVQSYNLELETGCYRAKPDVKAIVDYWKHFFRLSEPEREELSSHTFASYKANYNWDRVVKVWEDAIDATEPKNWNIPPRLIQPPPEVPKGLTNKQFIDWAVQAYLPYSGLKDSFEIMCILRDLNFGAFKNNPCGYFYSENSYFDRVNFSAFGRDHILNLFKQKAEAFNFWEKARVGQIQFKKESWLANDM
jgi:glycosyltransferase involved in cell wall biosynthesis